MMHETDDGILARNRRLGFRPTTAGVAELWARHARAREFDRGDRRPGGSMSQALALWQGGGTVGPDWEPHIATVRHWVERLSPYVGREEQIPLAWGVYLDGLSQLRDGFHRVTAARALGLASLPAWRPE
jgi:hypothetical protein